MGSRSRSNRLGLYGGIAIVVLAAVLVSSLAFAGSATADDVTLDQMDGDGSQENPYLITNVHELQAMEQNLAGHYALANDIDASETSEWEGGAGFDPIGDRDDVDEFAGSFDGNGYTISNLHIDRPMDEGIGLFGYSAGTVKNVRLENVDISGEERVGAVVGDNAKKDEGVGVVDNVVVSGETYATDRRVGGVVGANEGTVTDVSMNGEVKAVERRAGGIAGENEGPIDESYFVGTVESGYDIGGLVGVNEGPIRASFAAGNVIGDRYLGGVVGTNGDALNDVYSVANVSGERYIGGMAGRHSGTVTGVYVTGPVSADQDSAGLIAENNGIVNDAYWNTETTGHDEAFIADEDEFDPKKVDVTSLTTDELIGDNAGETTELDFDSPWKTTEVYPRFQWEDDRDIPDEAYDVRIEPVDIEEEDESDEEETDLEESPNDGDEDEDGPLAVPGFGPVTAIVALVAAVALVARRE